MIVSFGILSDVEILSFVLLLTFEHFRCAPVRLRRINASKILFSSVFFQVHSKFLPDAVMPYRPGHSFQHHSFYLPCSVRTEEQSNFFGVFAPFYLAVTCLFASVLYTK